MFQKSRVKIIKDGAIPVTTCLHNRFVFTLNNEAVFPCSKVLYLHWIQDNDILIKDGNKALHWAKPLKDGEELKNDLQVLKKYYQVGFLLDELGISPNFGTFLSKRLIINSDTLYCGDLEEHRKSSVIHFDILSYSYDTSLGSYKYVLKFNSPLPVLKPIFWIIGDSYFDMDVTFTDDTLYLLDMIYNDCRLELETITPQGKTIEDFSENQVLKGSIHGEEILINHKPISGFIKGKYPSVVFSENAVISLTFGISIANSFRSILHPADGYSGREVHFMVEDDSGNILYELDTLSFSDPIHVLIPDFTSKHLVFINKKNPVRLSSLNQREKILLRKIRITFPERKGFFLLPFSKRSKE